MGGLACTLRGACDGRARSEDEWDRLVAEEAMNEGLELGNVGLGDLRIKSNHNNRVLGGEGGWKREVRYVVEEISERLRLQAWQNHVLSEAMREIVKKERALAENESKGVKARQRQE